MKPAREADHAVAVSPSSRFKVLTLAVIVCVATALAAAIGARSTGAGPTSLSTSEPVCGPICTIFCVHGNIVDADGCPTCTCIVAPPSPLRPPSPPLQSPSPQTSSSLSPSTSPSPLPSASPSPPPAATPSPPPSVSPSPPPTAAPSPPLSASLTRLSLQGSPRIFRDGDSVAQLGSLVYRTDAIIRMTAKTFNTFELVSFVPVDLEDVEIIMSFQGGPQNVSVALIEDLPAHTIVELEYAFVTYPEGLFVAQDGTALDLGSMYGTGVATGQVTFAYRGTSTIMQRLEHLKSVPWALRLYDFDAGNNHDDWIDDPEPQHARLWTAHILNVAYLVTRPNFADRMAAEPITDNQGTLMSAEAKRGVLARLLSPRSFNLGVVTTVSGLGGGSTLGVASYVLKHDFFYGQQDGTTYHELGHVLGYSHASTMTYGSEGGKAGKGFTPLGMAFAREMEVANDILIDQSNYAFPDDHQIRCAGAGFEQACSWFMQCTGLAYDDGDEYSYCE